jgi:hypothetical protein
MTFRLLAGVPYHQRPTGCATRCEGYGVYRSVRGDTEVTPQATDHSQVDPQVPTKVGFMLLLL